MLTTACMCNCSAAEEDHEAGKRTRSRPVAVRVGVLARIAAVALFYEQHEDAARVADRGRRAAASPGRRLQRRGALMPSDPGRRQGKARQAGRRE